MSFLILAHVVSQQFHVQIFTQQSRQFGFTSSSGTQEQETGHGLLGVADAGKTHIHTLQHSIDGSILTMQALFDVRLEITYLDAGGVFQAIHGNIGHSANLRQYHLASDCHSAGIFHTLTSTGCIQEIDALVGILLVVDVSTRKLHGC